MDLAEGVDFAHDFKEVFQTQGYVFVASPTVIGELHEQSVNGSTSRKRRLAGMALTKLLAWDIVPLHLSTVETGIAERLAERFLSMKLVPEDECNDAMILAKTALAKVPLLVTSDKHLLDVEEAALALAFNDADLPAAYPVHAKALLRAMR
jgi:hypothetical protein